MNTCNDRDTRHRGREPWPSLRLALAFGTSSSDGAGWLTQATGLRDVPGFEPRPLLPHWRHPVVTRWPRPSRRLQWTQMEAPQQIVAERGGSSPVDGACSILKGTQTPCWFPNLKP